MQKMKCQLSGVASDLHASCHLSRVVVVLLEFVLFQGRVFGKQCPECQQEPRGFPDNVLVLHFLCSCT